MAQDEIGVMKRMLAAACHHCPLCAYGRKRPESLVGRILHHPWHADHCPLWRAERDGYDGDGRATGGA